MDLIFFPLIALEFITIIFENIEYNFSMNPFVRLLVAGWLLDGRPDYFPKYKMLLSKNLLFLITQYQYLWFYKHIW